VLSDQVLSSAIIGGARFLTGAHACWIGCGPSRTQRIYFANHTSHTDFVLILAALPRRLRTATRPVAAMDYWQRGSMRRYLVNRVFHAVLVDRAGTPSGGGPLKPMIEALDGGYSLILFPEGTRNSGEGLLPFKRGIFHLAMARPDVEMVPVWMNNAYRIMPKGSLLPIPLLCSTTFGAPVRLERSESENEFLERLH
jgi:1-acyl-sn-glycerol-3-phosphate acyltransferase